MTNIILVIKCSNKELKIEVKEFDFGNHFGIDPTKVKKQHKVVGIVEMLLESLKTVDSGLIQMNGQFRIYNGAFWELIDDDELKSTLAKFSELGGLSIEAARHFEMRDTLFKQLKSVVPVIYSKALPAFKSINLLNGTLKFEDRKVSFEPHNKDDLQLYQLPINYDPHAEPLKFYSFLDRVLPEKDKQLVLAEFIGSAFDPTFKHEKVLLNYGSGANGKSVFFEIIYRLFGPLNVSSHSLTNLTDQNGVYRFDLANRLLNFSTELSRKMESDVFKQLASGEPINARRLYENPIIIEKYARLVFNCNELPPVSERTKAYFRRLLIIPFDVTIPKVDQNPYLASEICEEELPGVLNWIIAGLERLWANNGFSDCPSCARIVDQYIHESDSVGLFMEEEYLGPVAKGNKIRLSVLYRKYKDFCEEGGFRPVNISNLRKRIENLGYQCKRESQGWVVFCEERGAGVAVATGGGVMVF